MTAAPPSRTNDAVALSATLAQIAGESPARPPVRLLHLGLGAFHRSHQLWHTAISDPENEWGYASFTGRSPAAADALAAQSGLYTVLVRSSEEDDAVVIRHLVAPSDGADLARLRALAADPAVAIITLTVTEAGYRLDPSGRVDLNDPATAADIAALRQWRTGQGHPPLTTALGRVVLALEARMAAGVGAMTVLPCDNMPANGRVVERAVAEISGAVSEELRQWIEDTVAFASSVVDRITPATTQDDIAGLRDRSGIVDRGAVVTEPFSEWIISGDFPAGRPLWERSGVRFVDDIAPFERRKLWMLNGAHTLLAVCGRRRGHTTVAEAIADPEIAADLHRWWDTVADVLPAPGLQLPAYRASLEDRFANSRIVHLLDQIAAETTSKLRFRVVPVLRAERGRGLMPQACVSVLAAWIADLRAGRRDPDAARTAIDAVLEGSTDTAEVTAGLLELLDPRLRADTELITAVAATSDHPSSPLPSSESEGRTRADR
ncbi:mannitol dehydrogenase family protein [Microbacterium invictum]|uniref:Mannitol-1-phosphate 5-dehydrogenase n=1 Tax=Microbacterium invictum TaxID=515415 RepID=A0ABZ0VBU2_9MICO|nr:mannitol dehydrogenase family protein [Microbacterium invictum]WQB71111.1 mannitol dehydrogenase family protein [Microbacterium invictum]